MSGVEYGLKQNSPTGKDFLQSWKEGIDCEREKTGKKRGSRKTENQFGSSIKATVKQGHDQLGSALPAAVAWEASPPRDREVPGLRTHQRVPPGRAVHSWCSGWAPWSHPLSWTRQ